MNEEHKYIFPCTYVDNYDGDTFDLILDLGFNINLNESVRIIGVDTPELRGGTKETKAAARLARDMAADFVNKPDAYVVFHSQEWSDKYGRPLGDIIVNGQSLTEFLIENYLGARYTGGNRRELREVHAKNLEYLKHKGLLKDYL